MQQLAQTTAARNCLRRSVWPGLALLVLGMLLVGCGAAPDGGAAPAAGANVSLQLHLPYVLGETAGASPAATGLSTALGSTFRGGLLALNIDTFDTLTFDWSADIATDGSSATSNKTIILPPGRYDFLLVLLLGDQHYAGRAFLQTLGDGENTIAMTVRPVIGDVASDVTVVERLADFRFDYDPAELSGLTNAKIGISIDGGAEQRFRIDPVTGLSEHMLLNLPAGSYHFELRLYEGEVQRGKSLAEQEQVLLSPGVDIAMDLVALHGEVAFTLDVGTGNATFNFIIPSEVVEEAGGLPNLIAGAGILGLNTGLRLVTLPVVEVGADYRATVTLPGFDFENVTVSLQFFDDAGTVPELLGGCTVGFLLSSASSTELCELVLRRRSILTGLLLGLVGVNVFNTSGEPIAGAIVLANGQAVGLTGTGFGTPGYAKVLLPADSYVIEAQAGGLSGSTPLTVRPLSLSNVDVVLAAP